MRLLVLYFGLLAYWVLLAYWLGYQRGRRRLARRVDNAGTTLLDDRADHD